MNKQEAIEILKRNKPTSDPRKCGVELCEAVDVAITALEKQRWISCSERLPEEDGEYLVWYDCGENAERGFTVVPFWTDIEKFGVYYDAFHPETLGFVDSEFYECETVVAWMPLPEPYKGN